MDADEWEVVKQKFHVFIIDPLLGFDTAQRKVYDSGEKSLHILFSEGLWGLVDSYRERRRVKKMQHKVHESKKISMDPAPWQSGEIVLPKPPASPEVSIIIPVHNNVSYTRNCLKSLADNTVGSYEIVIIDDASDDETPSFLSALQNITVIRNEKNQGFIDSCNRGGAVSKGQFLFFLNNDTLVTKDWLEPLLTTMRDEDVGAVGAKLVYPDGTLQEAGGIIFRDGSGWNYGRGDDPEKPEYNFIRETDYCSGAALMIRKALFDVIGGFDIRYRPGYYEDTDLCFSVRKLGKKVLYQPEALIYHYEGITAGTSESSGMKQYQERNREKFREKWADVLAQYHRMPDSRHLFLSRSRRGEQNILVIDHYIPTYDRDSGSLRMYNLLTILADLGFHVTFFGDNPLPLEPYTRTLQQVGIEVLYSPYVTSIEKYLKHYGHYFSIVILSRAHIAQKYIYHVKRFCPDARIIFDTVDLQYLRELRRYEIEGERKIFSVAQKFKRMELRLARMSDITLVVSPVEEQLLQEELPGSRIEILSNIHEVHIPTRDFSERNGILFIGGFSHPPNVDAVVWFIHDILPIIRESLPDIPCYMVGDAPPRELSSVSIDNVFITGYVPDVTGFFSDCRVFFAPLRYGAGIKGKINQSMSYGLPVVTTSMGAEGIGLVDEKNALIADDPVTFARAVIRLYTDEDLWRGISAASLENVRSMFSFDSAREAILRIVMEPANPGGESDVFST